jgi:hypothetical protein
MRRLQALQGPPIAQSDRQDSRIRCDEQGHFRINSLLAGLSYRLHANAPVGGSPVTDLLAVKPGETTDVGELVIKAPPPAGGGPAANFPPPPPPPGAGGPASKD